MIHRSRTHEVLEFVFPYLRAAAKYSRVVQRSISTHPEKEATNIFAAALTDADLSVQGFVEVVLLSQFPTIRFFGEEYRTSLNTKYFPSIEFGDEEELLAILDPIDGTRLYLDQRDDYQILFGLMTRAGFEGALAITPGKSEYFYSIKGEGTFRGDLDTPFGECAKVTLPQTTTNLLICAESGIDSADFDQAYKVFDFLRDYNPKGKVLKICEMITGGVQGILVREAQFLDAAMLCFMAQEAGAILSDFDGNPLPRADTCKNLKYPSIVAATTPEMHKALLARLRK